MNDREIFSAQTPRRAQCVVAVRRMEQRAVDRTR
jgi:hypothetical protein